MKAKSIWTGIVYVFKILTFSTPEDGDVAQLPFSSITPHEDVPVLDTSFEKYPKIGAPKQGGEKFTCEYPGMTDYNNCHGPENRNCWLKSKDGLHSYGIDTDYEYEDNIPRGIVREYHLEVSNMPLNLDGMTMEHGKVFNRVYPGPWIEACWGDFVKVTVTNKLAFNGTSIHFHGIRQYKTPHMDGVNGVTQCPIAPGDSFTYTFRAMQYGSSWYHSHYSLQYGDGLLGPMTIYGPSTANYDSDEQVPPILMTDWNHRSVFEDWPLMMESGEAPTMTNILLNGRGQYGPSGKALFDKYELKFDKDKRHMLILINTSVDTTFVFSIDEHMLQVIEADFVPIKPYTTDHIVVGIGQRYHVIVAATPRTPEKNGNYWIRTAPARKCSKFSCGPDEQMGILRYGTSKEKPLTDPFTIDLACRDEPYAELEPWLKWQVKDPVNIDPTNTSPQKDYIFTVGMLETSGEPYIPEDPITRWNMHEAPFRINFSEPTILNPGHEPWAKYLNVVTVEDTDDDEWIWMVITAPDEIPPDGEGIFFPAAHPMHLHGHDFALLKQSTEKWDPAKTELNCGGKDIKCDNPPRRDVALLPASGHLIIAFKADNPGPWLMHCHIAFHASSGLAMQIIENKNRINIPPAEQNDLVEMCRKWDIWLANPLNHWDFQNTKVFQDDSGV